MNQLVEQILHELKKGNLTLEKAVILGLVVFIFGLLLLSFTYIIPILVYIAALLLIIGLIYLIYKILGGK